MLALLIGGALVVVGGLNLVADPYRLYGSPAELPRIRPARLVKLELLRNASPPPEALVLGSSRVRTIAPAGVRYLFGTETFQLAGLKSSPANWLSATRYAVDDLRYPIRLVLLGVDPSSFVDVTNYLQHPASVPELRRHLRNPGYSRFRTLVNVWSPSQTKASLGVLVNAALVDWTGEVSTYEFDRNGFVAGFHPLDPKDITETAVSLHRAAGSFEREHLEDFEAFLDFASARDIRVVAFVTPETPAMRRALAGTHFPETLEATHDMLQQAGRANRLTYCEVDTLGLTVSDFVDPHHTSLDAGTRILGRLYRCASDRGAR